MADLPRRFSLFFAFASVTTLIISFYCYVYILPENKCEMTYMFQWPVYVEISLPNEVKKEYPRYGLFVYGEGDYANMLRRGAFSGIPVLFIPGNAGSHRQVRSLASVSLRKTESKRGEGPEFNYFSIDFDEELSGIYGGYLQRQTEFAAECLRKILSLYKDQASPPKSVIVIGHSMGGIIARGLLLDDEVASYINILITLASPHLAPVVVFDYALYSYYRRIGDYWLNNTRTKLENVTVLSVGGGRRDIMVRSSLTVFDHRLTESLAGRNATSDVGLKIFETTAPSIPLVWASTDHLCIVWCKQLVLAVVRALFDTTGTTSKTQGLDNVALRPDVSVHRKALMHHFFERGDWKSDEKIRKVYEERKGEDARTRLELSSKLASIFGDYAHFIPSICICYICARLISDRIIYPDERTYFIKGESILLVRGICALIASVFCIFRITTSEYASAAVAVFASFGLFSATRYLATRLVLAIRRWCRREKPSQLLVYPTSLYEHRALFAILLTFVFTSMYGSTVLLLLILICVSVIRQLRVLISHGDDDDVIITHSTVLVQISLALLGLTAPWMAVYVQNLRRNGDILPHDPTAVPTLLWIVAYALASVLIGSVFSNQPYNRSFRSQFYRFMITITPLMVAFVSVVFCDRLYLTTYCCGALLGFYSRVYLSCDWMVSSSKPD